MINSVGDSGVSVFGMRIVLASCHSLVERALSSLMLKVRKRSPSGIRFRSLLDNPSGPGAEPMEMDSFSHLTSANVIG